MSNTIACALCKSDNEQVIYSCDLFRIILVNDKLYPGFVRLILSKHIVEMSDLSWDEAERIFRALLLIEQSIRSIYNPDKINLASLGNIVTHLHWHIIPRYKDDRHFPNPIWAMETNISYQAPSYLFELQKKLIDTIKASFNK